MRLRKACFASSMFMPMRAWWCMATCSFWGIHKWRHHFPGKVQIFWEGHKNLHYLSYGFKVYLVNFIRQIVQIFVAFSEKLNFNAASKNIYLSTSNKTLYLCFLHHIVIAEQNEIKRCWQKQSIIIYKIHSLGRDSYCLSPSLNTQSCIRRPLCSTFRCENLSISPKKTSFFQTFSIKNKKKYISHFM